jgi:putative transposase
MTLSTGEYYANPRPFQRALRRLRRLQRSFDRRRRAGNPGNYNPDGTLKRGPREWWKSNRMLDMERRISRLHERVGNVRREQVHQLTTALTREYGVIGVESIATKNLMRNRRLARQIADVGWGMILHQLKYKAAWAGSLVIAADRYYPSSKTCNSCGAAKAKLSLSERVFTCDECDWECDRDVNAALNLAQMALQQAEVEGLDGVVVARADGRRKTRSGGRVSPGRLPGRCPVKREGSFDEPSQQVNLLAAA